MLKNEKIWQFLDGLSDSTPTPGGGSAAAMAGAMGASLVSMVARLTITNEKYAHVRKDMKKILTSSERIRQNLVQLIDDDTDAYKHVMQAYRMPKDDVKKRSAAIQKATRKATIIPFNVANLSLQVLELADAVSTKGMKNAVSDVGVGAALAHAAVHGAVYNVRINLKSIKDERFAKIMETDVSEILGIAAALSKKIDASVHQIITQ